MNEWKPRECDMLRARVQEDDHIGARSHGRSNETRPYSRASTVVSQHASNQSADNRRISQLDQNVDGLRASSSTPAVIRPICLRAPGLPVQYTSSPPGQLTSAMILSALAMCNQTVDSRSMPNPLMSTSGSVEIGASSGFAKQNLGDDGKVEVVESLGETQSTDRTAFDVNYIGEAFLRAHSAVIKHDATNGHSGHQTPLAALEKEDHQACEFLKVVRKKTREQESQSSNKKIMRRIAELEKKAEQLDSDLKSVMTETSNRMSAYERQVMVLSVSLVKLTEFVFQKQMPVPPELTDALAKCPFPPDFGNQFSVFSPNLHGLNPHDNVQAQMQNSGGLNAQ